VRNSDSFLYPDILTHFSVNGMDSTKVLWSVLWK